MNQPTTIEIAISFHNVVTLRIQPSRRRSDSTNILLAIPTHNFLDVTSLFPREIRFEIHVITSNAMSTMRSVIISGEIQTYSIIAITVANPANFNVDITSELIFIFIIRYSILPL